MNKKIKPIKEKKQGFFNINFRVNNANFIKKRLKMKLDITNITPVESIFDMFIDFIQSIGVPFIEFKKHINSIATEPIVEEKKEEKLIDGMRIKVKAVNKDVSDLLKDLNFVNDVREKIDKDNYLLNDLLLVYLNSYYSSKGSELDKM